MKPFEQQTYYELLEIPVSAPDAEILAAYARALETYSPDSVAVYTLVEPGQLDALRARLTEAMEILTEPELRAEYDQMIGVSRAGENTLAAPAPELVAPAPAAKPETPVTAAPEKPAASEAPVAVTPPAEPVTRPVAEALQAAASEPLPTREAPPAEASAPVASTAPSASGPESAPAKAPEPGAMLTVTPSQIHAAFRSYAISYVPVLVPAPAVSSAALVSPFAAPEPAAPPVPASAPPPEAPREPVASASAPPAEAPRQEPVPAAPPPVSASEPPPPAAPVASPPAEPAPVAAAPATPAPAEPPPAAAPPPPTPSARARVSVTPPPLPPGHRRPGRSAPTPPPVAPAHGSARAATPDRNLGEAHQLAQESAIATAEAALAQVAAKVREPRPKPLDLPPNTEFNGEVLRRVRESRGLSVQQLAERTRISAKHLENVEADRYTALPAQVYLRGFLMSMARELGLDPLKVSRSYLSLASGPQKK